MIEIDDKLVSLDVFEKKFVCNLSACKGACCVEGDAGAPLLEEEIEQIKKNLDGIKNHMTPIGIEKIEKEGISYLDFDNTPVTTLIDNKACAFVFYDENNTAKCSIEKAKKEGDSDFLKPLSCHLYPIRVKKMKYYEALNYDQWDVCKPACKNGLDLNVSVFRFLKEPLIRAYGEEFYEKLTIVNRELSKQ